MTLKEKITKIALDMPLINSPTKKEISDYENGLSNLEQIADEFAIEFGKWLNNQVIKSSGKHHNLLGSTKVTQLLPIFKKEKGL